MCSVFKPKDEEPYGNLNPKVSRYDFRIVTILIRCRPQNGFIVNSDGLFRSAEHVSFQI